MTQSIIDAYRNWKAIVNKYPVDAGSYDRTHGDNIAEGKRWAKLTRLIEAEGLELKSTLWKLANM